jgi:DNA-binding IclR family transcriptional regulator
MGRSSIFLSIHWGEGDREEETIMPRRSPDYSVPALEKGLAILEVLAESPVPMTLTGLSRALNRGSNEIFRMVNYLEEKSYIVRDAAGGYRLTLRLFGLAHANDPVRSLIRAAAPEMKRLSEESGESCHLGALDGTQLVVLHRVEGPRPVRLAVEVGGRFSVLNTVSGRMLLAGLPEEDLTRFLHKDPAFASLTKAAQARLLTRLQAIRQEGISTAVNESIEGVVDAAVAIGRPGTPLHATIAISALHSPKRIPDPMRFAEALRACAERISQFLS